MFSRWVCIWTVLLGGLGSAAARAAEFPGNEPQVFASWTPGSPMVNEPVQLTLTSSQGQDWLSSRKEVRWDLDGDGSLETTTGTSLTTQTTFTQPGLHIIRGAVTLEDRTVTTNKTYIAASLPSPPGLTGVSINGGAAYTNTADVTLQIVWPSGELEMLVSNDGGFWDQDWRPVTETLPWTLKGDGPDATPRTVYVRFMRSIPLFTARITLDRADPVVTAASVTKPLRPTAASTGGTLRLRARDVTSGVALIQTARIKTRPAAALPFSRTIRFQGVAPRWVRAIDAAGNIGPWFEVKR